MRQDVGRKEVERVEVRKRVRAADKGHPVAGRAIGMELPGVDAVGHDGDARPRRELRHALTIPLRAGHVQRDARTPVPLDLFHPPRLIPEVGARASALGSTVARRRSSFDSMSWWTQTTGRPSTGRQVAREIQAVDVDEIERGRVEELAEPPLKRARVVHERRVDAPERRASRVIPEEPDPAMALGNREDLDRGEAGPTRVAAACVCPASAPDDAARSKQSAVMSNVPASSRRT